MDPRAHGAPVVQVWENGRLKAVWKRLRQRTGAAHEILEARVVAQIIPFRFHFEENHLWSRFS